MFKYLAIFLFIRTYKKELIIVIGSLIFSILLILFVNDLKNVLDYKLFLITKWGVVFIEILFLYFYLKKIFKLQKHQKPFIKKTIIDSELKTKSQKIKEKYKNVSKSIKR